MRLQDYAGSLSDSPTLIVAAGPTTLDYADLRHYRHVVLVNLALRAAPLFSQSQIFFATVHLNVFRDFAEFTLPNIVGAFFEESDSGVGDSRDVPQPWPDWASRAIWYKPDLTPNFWAAKYDEFRERVRDVPRAINRNELCGTWNSSHFALHLAYVLGAREVHTVGCGGPHGRSPEGYDRRLCKTEIESAALDNGKTLDPGLYIRAFWGWASMFDWRITQLDRQQEGAA